MKSLQVCWQHSALLNPAIFDQAPAAKSFKVSFDAAMVGLRDPSVTSHGLKIFKNGLKWLKDIQKGDFEVPSHHRERCGNSEQSLQDPPAP